MKDEGVTDKVVVITGAAGRLGRHVVDSFGQAGAQIAAVDKNEEAVRNLPFPGDAEGWAFPADVTDVEQVRECFDEIQRRFGHVDALIHAAGGWEARPFLDTSLKNWESMIQLNLTSTFLCFREAVRHMGDRGGRLIAMASAPGADGGVAEQAGYSASKAGVIRLVESVSREFQKRNITAHAIAPSMILFDDEAEQEGVPAGRLVELCHLLLGPAGEALNGQVLRAYGTRR